MRALLLALTACAVDPSIADPEKPGSDDCETVSGFVDNDGDGVGAGELVEQCVGATLASTNEDCDDGNANVAPGLDEACDGVDQDCDLDIDEGSSRQTWYFDVDADGFGGEAVEACVQPAGAIADDGDCDDAVQTTFPGADELCNGVDDDCDRDIDEDAIDAGTWYRDADGDGFGATGATYAHCGLPPGAADNDLDCDDADPAITDTCPTIPQGHPAPAGAATCAGGATYSFQQATGQPELHVVSVYEPTGVGTIDVYVDRPTTMTLMLSSYEEVQWLLHVDPAVTLEGVLINGYDAQVVQGVPANVPTLTRTLAQTGTNFGYWCGYSWPYNGGGCDTNLLIAGVESFLGQTTTGFIGCYTGEAFRVQ